MLNSSGDTGNVGEIASDDLGASQLVAAYIRVTSWLFC